MYQIEVRASSEQYDVHARQIIREILHLPTKQLPSLANITATISSPFFFRTTQLYRISGSLATSQLDQLATQLLSDPIVQETHVTTIQDRHALGLQTGHIVDVFFHPGVTDTLAASVLTGAHMLGIDGIERVETGQRYMLDQRLSEKDVRIIAQDLLYNPVIQVYSIHTANQAHNESGIAEQHLIDEQTATEDTQTFAVTTIPISTMADAQLLEVSKAGLLSLSLEEMRTIQHYYQEQQREPSDIELETLAQTWSEHCSHKTFKATVHYRELNQQGQELASETIHGLLKSYIMRATEEVRPAWLVSAFSDNAGIIRFTEQQDLAFKVETHNHPSAIEPFGGANTGVGGVIRDVLGVSAQPIACTDVLCFGPQDTPIDALPKGVLAPSRIASGVVNGVRDYGNKMGIPTVNGAVLYHSGYIYNPLVFCGCLGILPHGSHPSSVEPGDLIVVLGGRTGRDGIHGATFSSGEMSSEINAQAGTAVQIGAPITEKTVTDVIIQARDRQLYHAITDCGAGGFSSAIGEMGEQTGAHVELAEAPLKYQGLTPWEIWLSEAQERMVLAVPPQKLDDLLELCTIEEVEASILGTFSNDQRLLVSYHGQVVANLDMHFLHKGNPTRTMDAHWTRPADPNSKAPQISTQFSQALTGSFGPALLAILRHPNVASKEAVVRRYDHEVQGATVLKPLVGRSGNGPGDAAALQPILAEQSVKGIILSNGVNPLYGKIDAYHMATNAIDEALRNLTAVGGNIEHAAILDNFCWGNPNDPAQLGTLVRAVKGCYDAASGFGTPFISGKDSLNNEYRTEGHRVPVLPTLVISAVGVIEDASRTVDMALKTPGNLLYLIGPTSNELAGSYYGEVVDQDSFDHLFANTAVPHVNVARARSTMKVLGEAIRAGLVRSCHDLSEGGLALAAAEMSLAGQLGINLDISHITSSDTPALSSEALNIVRLFSESPSRFLVEVTPEQLGAFEKYLRTNAIKDTIYIGAVTNAPRFVVYDGEQELMNLSVAEIQEAWKGDLA
jgi:phosphoribosylformylglycinamidine synthase